MGGLRPFFWEKLRDKILPFGLEVLEYCETLFFPVEVPPAPKKGDESAVSLVLLHGMGGGADAQALVDAEEQRRKGKRVALLYFRVLRRRFVLTVDGAEAETYPFWAFRRLWHRLDALSPSDIRLHHLRYWPWAMSVALERYIASRRMNLIVFLHDFCYFCPRIHLLDGAFNYCGQPEDPKVCDACLRRSGPFVRKKGDCASYRATQKKLLSRAKKIVASSGDTAARYQKIWPEMAIDVRPEMWGETSPVPQEKREGKARLAVVGNIGRQKGADIVLSLARYIKENKLDLDIMVIGSCLYAGLLERNGVRVTGPYQSKNLPQLFVEHGVTGVWFPSPWPETYSFVLSETWRCGLPVAAFDLGAPAERIRQRADGRDKILPLSMMDDMEALHRALFSFTKGE